MRDDDERLLGGNMGDVVRRGDTVVRPAGDWTPAVHRLLRHVAAAGVTGVPSPLGLTEDGREVLSFVHGEVPHYPMPSWVWRESSLDSAARLLQSVHEATADADMTGPWRSPSREPVEVVCHNDVAPYNLVFEDATAVGIIDWDHASPGPRLWDVAYLAYRIVPLTTGDIGDGFTESERLDRLRRLLGVYGTDAEPEDVLDVVRERLLALAASSDDAAVRLHDPRLRRDAALYRRDADALTRPRRPGSARR